MPEESYGIVQHTEAVVIEGKSYRMREINKE
jgi:hypothetical protein